MLGVLVAANPRPLPHTIQAQLLLLLSQRLAPVAVLVVHQQLEVRPVKHIHCHVFLAPFRVFHFPVKWVGQEKRVCVCVCVGLCD